MSRFAYATKLLIGLSAGAALVLLTAAAGDDQKPSHRQQCFYSGQYDTEIIDDHHFLFKTSTGHQASEVTVSGCRLDVFSTLIFEFRGGSDICDAHDFRLFERSNGMKSPCFVDSMRPLSIDELKTIESPPHHHEDKDHH